MALVLDSPLPQELCYTVNDRLPPLCACRLQVHCYFFFLSIQF